MPPFFFPCVLAGSEKPTVLRHWSRISALAWSCGGGREFSAMDLDQRLLEEGISGEPQKQQSTAGGLRGRSLLIGRSDGSVATFENGSLEEICHVSRENGECGEMWKLWLYILILGN